MINKTIGCCIFLLLVAIVNAQNQPYTKFKHVKDIPPPDGYTRKTVESNSFAAYLRTLPIKQTNNLVMLYNGKLKGNQTAQYAVINMDVGKRDLQQCADAVMRLRAEYLRSIGNANKIHFNFTSGHRADYAMYAQGYRPSIKGGSVRWVKTAAPDTTYKGFRKYMDIVFTYAGTYSLKKELHKVEQIAHLQAGDVFIQGGFPGHAIVVADVVKNKDGDIAFMLAQSYMPAQEIHLLINNESKTKSPWYFLSESKILNTPEWNFNYSDLMRFEND